LVIRVLRLAWARWQIIAKINGDAIARLTAFSFYYTIFALFAIGARLFVDPLKLKRPSGWGDRNPVGSSLSDAREQF